MPLTVALRFGLRAVAPAVFRMAALVDETATGTGSSVVDCVAELLAKLGSLAPLGTLVVEVALMLPAAGLVKLNVNEAVVEVAWLVRVPKLIIPVPVS